MKRGIAIGLLVGWVLGMFSAMLDRIEKAPAEPRQLALPEEPRPEQPS